MSDKNHKGPIPYPRRRNRLSGLARLVDPLNQEAMLDRSSAVLTWLRGQVQGEVQLLIDRIREGQGNPEQLYRQLIAQGWHPASARAALSAARIAFSQAAQLSLPWDE